MKFYATLFLVSLGCLITMSCSKPFTPEFSQTDHESLEYINDKAIKFIEAYNQEHGTKWESLEVDQRIMVYKCVTPMQTEWSKQHHSWQHEVAVIWSVKVSCAKTVNTYPESKEWSVLVPTTRPIESLE